jgi:hypothetical protein
MDKILNTNLSNKKTLKSKYFSKKKEEQYKIPHQYKNSIYYNTDSFRILSKNIMTPIIKKMF